MATNCKEAVRSPKDSSDSTSSECCMCGDRGVSDELFQCKICHFRSQHSYCSNQYPKAESYQVCNWCHHSQSKDECKDKSTQLSSNKSNSREEDDSFKNNNGSTTRVMRSQRLSNLQLQPLVVKKPIKKQASSSSPTATRKRIITNGALEETRRHIFRRTMSEEMSKNNSNKTVYNSGIIRKPVFRNKVRRYKLLDEVSS